MSFGRLFPSLERTDPGPDCGVSIRTSRTICRFMNIHYGNHGNDMHRLFLWQPFTPAQNIPARQLVSKAVVRCLGETLRVCLRNWPHLIRGTLEKKFYRYPFFLLKLSFQQSRCMYSVFRHVRQVCPLINIASYWNRIHITFGCYLITIEMSILFLSQSSVEVAIYNKW